MKDLFLHDDFKIIQKGFNDKINEIAESVTSLGNGSMGFRGNFEETFTGSTLKGTYTAGVFYPDKTKVGWWKNGYPEYFAKALNSCDFISLKLYVDEELVDINKCEVLDFKRVLDMQSGTLERLSKLKLNNGKTITINSFRFVSMANKECGAIRYKVECLEDASIKLESIVDGNVINQDSNYDEMFWNNHSVYSDDHISSVTLSTKKTDYLVSSSAYNVFSTNGSKICGCGKSLHNSASVLFEANVVGNESVLLEKYFCVTTSRDYDRSDVQEKSLHGVKNAKNTGFDQMLLLHKKSGLMFGTCVM